MSVQTVIAAWRVAIDALLHRFWKLKIGILAGLFTGAETLVSMGYQLPLSKAMPGWLRAVIYLTIISGAFILRWLAMSKEHRDASDSTDGDADGK